MFKYLKLSLVLGLVATGLSSCLKDRSVVADLYDDKGTIVSAIAERQYINVDAQNLQSHYEYANANFNFTTRPNEAVKFFTVRVSQPRETKVSGNLVIKCTAGLVFDQPASSSGVTAVPAGAINVTDIVIPASNASEIVFPVFFTVNKTLLNPADLYGARFTITVANQGVVSKLDESIDVLFNYTDFLGENNATDITANYAYQNSFVDPAGQFVVNNQNKRQMLLEVAPGQVEELDPLYYAQVGVLQNLLANNTATGAPTSIFKPRFLVNASGQITAVQNASSTATITNLQLDPTYENRFVYTNNNTRTFRVRYTFTYTTTLTGATSPTARTVTVTENFSYDKDQVYF